MKKNLIYLFICFAALVSCQDAYDIKQPGVRTDEAEVFKNNNDIIRGISYVYEVLPAETEIGFNSIFTDELAMGITASGISNQYSFFLVPNEGRVKTIWYNYLTAITQTNLLLSRIEDLIKTDKSEKEALQISKGRLLLLRAYAHFKLFSYFTTDYTNPEALAVYKYDFKNQFNTKKTIKRSKVSEIVSFIVRDVNEALKYDIDNKVSIKNVYVSKAMAHGLLVKLYSMTQEYDKLEDEFSKIQGFNLGTFKTFIQAFSDTSNATNPDIIFSLIRTRNNPNKVAANWYRNNIAKKNTFIEMEVGRSLYNELDKLDPQAIGKGREVKRRDARYLVNILEDSTTVASNYKSLNPAEFKKQDILLIGKYKGKASSPLQNDVHLMRYTDLYLALAEAKAAKGDLNTVKEIISNVRKARSENGQLLTEISINSPQQAWKAILDERRMEFAFEGTRYLDIKRLAKKAEMIQMDRDPQDYNGEILKTDSYKMTMPFPTEELPGNAEAVQNPGY